MNSSQVVRPSRFTYAAIAIFVLLTSLVPVLASAQTKSAHTLGVDVTTHVFRPKVSPEQMVTDAQRKAAEANPSTISATALQQMQALAFEKASRTPAQQKISSQLLATVRMLRGEPVAIGVPYLETGVELDDNNNMFVDISAEVSDELLERISSLGGVVINSYPQFRSIRAMAPPNQLEQIAGWPDVYFINPKQNAVTNGSGWNLAPGFDLRAARVKQYLSAALDALPGAQTNGVGSQSSEGDVTHKANIARSTYGISGAGLKIGVLSDGVTSLAQSQALGDLGPVTVLSGQAGSGDEGTAMLEIIHDLAPSAQLYFATAMNSSASFAQNIINLRVAGCDIIVDDVGYFAETPFQDGQATSVVSNTNGGIVIQAVNNVTTDGALYFSSAANSGNLVDSTSGTWEGDFADAGATGAPLPTGVGNMHLFSAGNSYDTLTYSTAIITLFWSDPLGGSNNDYDLYLLNSTGTAIVSSSTNIQSGTTDPYEYLYNSAGIPTNDRIVIVKKTGAATRFLHLATNRGRLAIATTGATVGHNAAKQGYSVAATPAYLAAGTGYPVGPYPGVFTSANVVEPFTSDGPRRIFFNADGTLINSTGGYTSTGGELLNKPDFTAADGVAVTGVGGFGSPFYGTSAAAPHAAAIAALVKSAKPTATSSDVHTALFSSVIDIMAAGWDPASGAGIIMADTAVGSLGTPGYADPVIGTITATENPGNGNGSVEPGEGARLVIQLSNQFGVAAATGITTTLTTSTPGVTITQPASSAYADLAVGASGTNLTPFTFTLASNFSPCATTIGFSLTVNFTGGPLHSRTLDFVANVGRPPISLTGVLGTAPPAVTGFTTATGSQTGRMSRSGVASACGPAKSWPGLIDSASRVYNSYTFTACGSGCVDFGLKPSATVTPAGVAQQIFDAAYSPTFTPGNIQTNYVGDAGASVPAGSIASFTLYLSATNSYTMVIHEVNPGTGTGQGYNLTIPSCAINCSGPPNQVPVALAHSIMVTAGAGGTANASVDNGSYDPDGDPLTITQTPPGPYSVGNTSVLLTVTDTKGATAQAGPVTVTVNPSGPDLTITKTHTANFAAGQTGATYTLTVSNSGTASTSGTVTVVDALPTGLTATALSGTGWSCTLGTLTCTRSDVLATSGSYPAITLTVNVAANAPSSVTNTATVSGGGEVYTANDSASDVTTISSPDLAVSKSHGGNFSVGQTGTHYWISAYNMGLAATYGTVTVTDTLPTGLTATAIDGIGWNCTLGTLTCTRSDSLAASSAYPEITLTVDVAANAPSSVTNIATVSGGGEVNTANDTASDVTTIVSPDLTITKSHTGNFVQGQTGATYSLTASNTGTAATSGSVTVTDTLPASLTATAITGTGWSCTLGTLTCTRSDVLATSSSYPAITLTVNVSASAPASVTNTATVSGGGEVNTSNDTASDGTTISPPTITITNPASAIIAKGQTTATVNLSVTGNMSFATAATLACTSTGPITCQFNPATAAVSTTASPVVVTLTTTATAMNHMPSSWPRGATSMLAMLLGVPAIFFIPVSLKKTRSQKNGKRRMRYMSGLTLLLLAILMGCGGGSKIGPGGGPGTPTNYTVQVTATSGSTQGTSTINVTIYR